MNNISLDAIFNEFREAVKRPTSYIVLGALLFLAYRNYTDNKAKDERLLECEAEKKRLNDKFVEFWENRQKIEENNEYIKKLNN